MRFIYTISHVPGKQLTVADTLSREPVFSPTLDDKSFNSAVDAFVDLMIQSLPVTKKRLQQIHRAQKEDAVCCKLIKYYQNGWPDRNLVPAPMKP